MRSSNLLFGVIGVALGVLIAVLMRQQDQPEQAAHAEKMKLTGNPKWGAGLGPAPGSNSSPFQLENLMEPDELDRADVEAMLQLRGYSREALISAALLTGDLAHLKMAAERFPGDPQVQLLVITNDVFPEARSEWIDRLKQSQPDNSLASVLKSGDQFASGKQEEALEQLRLAASQPDYEGFTTESMLAMESGLIDLGYGSLESKLRSTMGLPLPELQMIRKTLNQLHPLAESAATVEERNDLATLGIVLGNQLSQGAGRTTIINGLVGMATENKFLKLLEPDYQSPTLSATPAEMLAEIETERQEISEIIEFGFGPRLQELDEAKFSHYLDRLRTQGELEAIRWAREQLE